MMFMTDHCDEEISAIEHVFKGIVFLNCYNLTEIHLIHKFI